MFSYEQSMLKTFASKFSVIVYWLVKKSYNGEIDPWREYFNSDGSSAP